MSLPSVVGGSGPSSNGITGDEIRKILNISQNTFDAPNRNVFEWFEDFKYGGGNHASRYDYATGTAHTKNFNYDEWGTVQAYSPVIDEAIGAGSCLKVVSTDWNNYVHLTPHCVFDRGNITKATMQAKYRYSNAAAVFYLGFMSAAPEGNLPSTSGKSHFGFTQSGPGFFTIRANTTSNTTTITDPDIVDTWYTIKIVGTYDGAGVLTRVDYYIDDMDTIDTSITGLSITNTKSVIPAVGLKSSTATTVNLYLDYLYKKVE